MGIGTLLGLFSVPPKNFLFAATYTMNYMTGGVWITGHIWSLSVEEQFYLVWPLTMKLAGSRRALWIAGVLAVTAPLLCLAIYLIDHTVGSSITRYFPFVADSIAAGCLLAGALPWLRRQRQFFRWFASPLGDLVVPLILILDLGRNHPRIHLALGETALNLCICYAIVRYTEFPHGIAARILNNPCLAFIGKLSYSLYLWQQVFMNSYGRSLVQAFPLNVVASFTCALISYYTIELPMAGMRKRLRASTSRESSRARSSLGVR